MCCALGYDGAYIYATPTHHKWHVYSWFSRQFLTGHADRTCRDKLDSALVQYLEEKGCQKVTWAALGPEQHNCVITYINKNGAHRVGKCATS